MDEGDTKSKKELHFFYDAQNRPALVKWNNAMYRYVHNLQGDIVGIVDAAGNLVVEYKYDAWGKPLSITGTLKTSLGELNPFRYRGYIWDEETGLYYLKSRHYNPHSCRFINGDVLLSDTLTGKNVYLYCANTPVASCDDDGCSLCLAILNNLFHREVQKAIVDAYCPESGRMEYPITNLPTVGWRITTRGKLDVYDTTTHCFWEVKKATLSMALGLRQVKRYMDGETKTGTHPIPGGWVEGRTSLEFGGINFGIVYYSVAPGLVVYEVTNLSTMQPVPVPSKKAIRNMTENRNAANEYWRSGRTVPGFSGVVKAASVVFAAVAAVAIGISTFGATGDLGMAWNAASQVFAY